MPWPASLAPVNLYSRLSQAASPTPRGKRARPGQSAAATGASSSHNHQLLDILPPELVIKILARLDVDALEAFFRTSKEARCYRESDELQLQWLLQQRPGTALVSACNARLASTAMRLIPLTQAGSINTANSRKGTALHYACAAGLLDVVTALTRRQELEVNAVDAIRRTPLLLACKAGHTDVVRVLTRLPDVDISLPDCEGETPLLAACSEGHPDIVELLLSRAPMLHTLACLHSRQTPLLAAASRGHVGVVQKLLMSNAARTGMLNLRGPHRTTALHEACRNGHSAVVQLLLDSEGIDWQAMDRSGRTPLDLAGKHPGIVKLLVECSKKLHTAEDMDQDTEALTPDSDEVEVGWELGGGEVDSELDED